jgi:hypothetical protein
MGSTIDNITCPKCKYKEATTELYYKTGEEIIFCSRCGYHLEHNVYKGGKGKATGGKGIIYVGFECGGTSVQVSKKYLDYLKQELEKDNVKNGNGESPKEVYYTKKVDGKWKKFYLLKKIND